MSYLLLKVCVLFSHEFKLKLLVLQYRYLSLDYVLSRISTESRQIVAGQRYLPFDRAPGCARHIILKANLFLQLVSDPIQLRCRRELMIILVSRGKRVILFGVII